MTLIKICSGKGWFSQSGGSFFQNFPWHVGPNYGGPSNVTKYLAPPLFQTCRRPCSVFILLINASNYNLNETTKSTCITNSRNRPSCLQKLGKLQSHQSPLQKKKIGIISQKLRKNRFQKIMICSILLDGFPFGQIFCSKL